MPSPVWVKEILPGLLRPHNTRCPAWP